MASGTKFIREINDQFLICKICHETYRDPKTLTCLHTFCSDCIQQHVDSERERASRFAILNRYVNCPLCRKKTEIPNGGVRRLPDNFLVSNLTDVVNRRRSVKKPSCEICQSMRSRTNQACSKCLECSKLLCKACVELHRKTKVTEQHSLFDIEDEKDVECKVHPDEVVRFFCEPCETCVCILCTFQEHSEHEVCSFTEGFSKNKNSLDNLLHKCRDRATDVQSLLNTINKCETLKKETQESIRDQAINYTAQVRSMEKKLLKKVESAFSGAEVIAFTQTKDWLRECLDSIRSTCDLTDVILKDRNLEMLLLKKEIHGKLSTLMEPVLPTVPVDVSTEIKFIPGTVKLGYLSVTKDSSDSDSLPTASKCVVTQTEMVSLDNASTSMGADVTQPLIERSKGLQTEPPPVIPTANKEVSTTYVHKRDKGVHARIMDVKSKGVMTEKISLNTVKSQTDKLHTYDMGNMATLSNQDACVNTLTLDTCEKYAQASPDMKSRGNLTNLPNNELLNGSISYESYTDLSSNVPHLNNIITEQDNDKSKNASDFTNAADHIQDRGVQTLVSENNPLHKPTKSTSVMTDTVNVVGDYNTSPVRFPSNFEDDLCLECRKNKPTFGARQKQYSESKNSSNRLQQPELMFSKQTRTFGTDPIRWADKPFLSKSEKENLTDSSTCTGTLNETDEQTHDISKQPERVSAVPNLLPLSCIMDAPSLVDNYTAMSPVLTQERETCTKQIQLSDRWTCTEIKQLVNANTSTNKLHTKDKGVVTPKTMTLDQFTNTHIVECKECEIEAVVTTSDNETLTDKTVYTDAQTASETIFTDSSTWIDFQSQQEANTMTYVTGSKDQHIMVRPFMFNKRTSTSRDFDNTAKTIDTECQVALVPPLTRNLPESIMPFVAGNPSDPYREISIPVPTTERGTECSPILTCDQSTMALSILQTDGMLSVYTQTPGPTQFDSLEQASFGAWLFNNEAKLSCEEKATSTESLVYMGLLSQLDDIDELFFVPNVTLETVSSTTSLSDVSMETDHIEMLDQEMCTDQISFYDCGTQTYLTLSPDDESILNSENSTPSASLTTSNLTDASTNTLSVSMVCRETCTPPRYHLSKSTMTHYVAKTDNCTNTARRANRWDHPVVSTCEIGVSTDSLAQLDKHTMTSQSSFRDSSVSTDSVFIDGKMAECIVKLKNVSDRLHSPTQKSQNNNIFSTRNQLARQKIPGLEDMLIKRPETLPVLSLEETNSSSIRSLSEEERKRNVQELLLQTQITLQKPKPESPRKLQPITTLKTKSGDRLAAIEEENYKSRSLPRQFPDREQLTGVRMGRQAMTSRLPLLRYNSAPGRIATVPTQKLNILPRSPTRKSPVPPTKIPPAISEQEQDLSPHTPPSVVADRRSSSQIRCLPVISETRTPSSCSSCSTVSSSSVETVSSGTVSSDVMPPQLVKKHPITSYSSSSTSSIQSMVDTPKNPRKSAMSFMQRILPRKKKSSDPPTPKPERPQPRVSTKNQPIKEQETPMSPKKSRPFVYMRQRIFSIQHDGESSKSSKEKNKKGKNKTKLDSNSPSGGGKDKPG